MRFTRITIIRQGKPREGSINYELQWFGESIGLFNKRDKDKSCFRIFITLLKSLKGAEQGLTSDEIAEITALSRGTVVHHLNKLMSAGIVSAKRNRYVIEVDNLEDLVAQLQQDMEDALDSIRQIAKEIDDKLEL